MRELNSQEVRDVSGGFIALAALAGGLIGAAIAYYMNKPEKEEEKKEE